MVEYHPISAEDLSRLHQFDKKVLPGMFLGYALHTERIWKGDIFFADIDEFGGDGRIWNPWKKAQCKRKCQRHWEVKSLYSQAQMERDQVLRTSTLIWDHPVRGEGQRGQPFKGPIIPFGSFVEYYPITAKDQSRIHQFGKKVLPGLFLGYALYAGWIWKGDVLIADLEELETMDASEIYSKRLNAKEVIFPKQGEFIFPIEDGRIKPLGGDQDLRTSTLIRQRPIRGESHLDFLGESEGSPLSPQDSYRDAGEARNDFWSMSGNFIDRHHVEPGVKLYVPRE